MSDVTTEAYAATGEGGRLPSTMTRVRDFTLRRWPSLASIAILGLVAGLDVVGEFAAGLIWAALLYLLWAAARKHVRRPGILAVQAAAVVAFGAIGFLAATVDQPLARYVLALGWLGHAAWDVVHLLRRLVVPRWWAEACAVLDALLVVAVLVVV